VIFADVKLQPGDDAEQLGELGLLLRAGRKSQKEGGAGLKFLQPCHAHDGCRCGIYAQRPRYCREFECVLLKSAAAGRTSRDEALRIIVRAKERAKAVRQLLIALGDQDEELALGARFRRMRRRLEQGHLDDTTADLYGRLTLAVHELNLIVSQAFYPGTSG
jgi:Fe-S-cluster containining protein